MEFWNSLLTEKSWQILQEIRERYDFVLIGGWASYLWTKQQKSKDIDIIVGIKELEKLKQENLIKNDHLKKYEIKREEVDIDIYVSYFSKLAIPVEDIKKFTSKVEGFEVVIPELLIILKQGAEHDRGNSVKGEKDRLDIISLLFFTKIDFGKYLLILKQFGIDFYVDELISILRGFQDYESFSLTPSEFKRKREALLRELKKLPR